MVLKNSLHHDVFPPYLKPNLYILTLCLHAVLGMDAALQYINRTRLHQAQYVTVKDILEIHKRVLGFVNLEEAGRFRQTQVGQQLTGGLVTS